MAEAESTEPFESRVQELFARVAPSIVDVFANRAGGAGEFHTFGVVAERGGVTAWSGLEAAAGEWENLETISIRQGTRSWRAELHSLRADWRLCVLRVHGEFTLPTVPWRRSNTLAMGERLFYVVEGSDLASPRLGSAELVDVMTLSKKSYGRPRIWTAALDPDLPREYSFAFDLEGRVAGLLEPLPDAPSLAGLLAGEWVGCLVKSGWAEALFKTGALKQLAEEYQAQPDAYEAEALCTIGLALHGLGDREGAIGAWERASLKDPLNPWPHRALSALLMQDESTEDEALAHFCRATELEAEEPAAADEIPRQEGPPAVDRS